MGGSKYVAGFMENQLEPLGFGGSMHFQKI
jgi:hypothetical protein